jgi:REP element-mobilizing transposase RayT
MQPGKRYHLYTHANGSENFFRTEENYRYFLQRYQHFIPLVADTLAYCLMPNHFHFLVRIKTEAELISVFKNKLNLYLTGLDSDSKKDLSGIERGLDSDSKKDLSGIERGLDSDSKKDLSGIDSETKNQLSTHVILQFSHLFNAYTKAYNKVYKRRGSLFTRAFRRKEITSDSYLTTVIHYLHANPVHHGFEKSITHWPWSSYHDLLNNSSTWLDRAFVINWFGGAEKFRDFHQQPIALKAELED